MFGVRRGIAGGRRGRFVRFVSEARPRGIEAVPEWVDNPGRTNAGSRLGRYFMQMGL
jgi:hypothetical protein